MFAQIANKERRFPFVEGSLDSQVRIPSNADKPSLQNFREKKTVISFDKKSRIKYVASSGPMELSLLTGRSEQIRQCTWEPLLCRCPPRRRNSKT